MKYALMTYTIARQCEDSKVDMVQMCKLANELGLDAMDQVYLYGYEASEVKRIADDYGIKIICYTFGTDVNFPDSQSRAQGVDIFKREIDAACILGAPRVMLPIGGKPQFTREESRRNVIDGLKDLVPIGRAAGIDVSIEHFTAVNSPFILSTDMDEAIAEVPGLCITFDSGNMLTGGEDPIKAFLNNKNQIIHAHFKDWTLAAPGESGLVGLDGRTYKGALIGEGIIDYPTLIRTMTEAGYNGYIDIEYESDDYKADFATKKALDYLRNLEVSSSIVPDL